MDDVNLVIKKLVIANRILAAEGVVDAYGHISARHPNNPKRYFLARSRSPELVEVADIMEFELDGTPVDAQGRKPYLERYIHGALYEARPEVNSVVHNHAREVVPFSVSKTRLRPIAHVCGRIGANVPVWDIRDKFGDTDLLVVNMEQGHDLARCVGNNVVALMRGHGAVATGPAIEEAVLTAIYLQVNAKMQMDAMRLGDVTYLSPGEIEKTLYQPKVGTERAWEYLCSRIGVSLDQL
jgi:ribulose-5-phosphate 4-epimerase/fuculose-1-phosphate aldolase